MTPNDKHPRIRFLSAKEVAALTKKGEVICAVDEKGKVVFATKHVSAKWRQESINKGTRYIAPHYSLSYPDIEAFITDNTINGIYTPPPDETENTK